MEAVKTDDKVLHQQHGIGTVVEVTDDKITVEFQSEPELERRLSPNNLMQRIVDRNIQVGSTLRGTSVKLRVPISSMSPDVWKLQPNLSDGITPLSHIKEFGSAASSIINKTGIGWRASNLFSQCAAPSVKKIVREADSADMRRTAQMLIEVSDLIVSKALDSHAVSNASRATSGIGVRMTLTRCLDALHRIDQEEAFWYASIPKIAAENSTYTDCLNILLLRCITREAASEQDIYSVARNIEEVLESRFTSLFSLHLLSTAQLLYEKVGNDFHHPYLSKITKLESRVS